MKTKKKSTVSKPRVNIPFNTGTRIIKSKKDKAKSRKYLKQQPFDED